MNDVTSAVRGKLVVAVAFDDHTDALVATAKNLAKRFSMAMRFVHVLEPIFEPGDMIYGPGGAIVPYVVVQTRDEALAGAEAKMKSLLQSLGHEIPADGQVLEGPLAETVVAEAVSWRANLILCSARAPEYRLVPRGFSVALSLMHLAPLPVLVIGDAPVDLGRDGLRILLADDLSDVTRGAVQRAYELAAKHGSAAVRHVHVHGDFREHFRDRWDELLSRLPSHRDRPASLASVWAADFEARVAALRERGGDLLKTVDAVKGAVNLDVRTGEVSEQLHLVVESFDPHLIVFGRHRFWRTRPFLIGRMPLKAMFAEGRPVLVVPSPKEGHPMMPFPAN